MKVYSVFDPEFAAYGKVIPGFDNESIMKALNEHTPLPEGVDYVPSEPALECLSVFEQMRDNVYGGMPVQLGWCNGHNTKLNCLEYHRDSEINLGTEDFILLLAKQEKIVDGVLDTADVEAGPGTRWPTPTMGRSRPTACSPTRPRRPSPPATPRTRPSGPATSGCWPMQSPPRLPRAPMLA